MLHALLNWFYCLPFTQALFFLVIFSLFFLLFRQRLGKKGFWRPGVALFALFWLFFIVSATLFDRGISESRTDPALIPFFSYYSVLSGGNKEILRSNFMNVVLFFPAGLLVSEIHAVVRRVITLQAVRFNENTVCDKIAAAEIRSDTVQYMMGPVLPHMVSCHILKGYH